MSSLAMPLLIINLGGEMSYILEQRLQAQNVIEDKSVKVLHEIIAAMMNKPFIKKLFYPQSLATKTSMRLLFEKIAHASIMRLNEASMDKLFDLMTMAVKYHVVMVCNSYELLNLTMNHLDGIRTVMKGHDAINECVDYAHKLLRQVYFTLPEWKMALVRDSMLSFFQDAKVKVSILMREDKQGREGDIITDTGSVLLAPHSNLPGTIRYYVNGECMNVTNFPLPSKYTINDVTAEQYDKRLQKDITDRGTTLGTNMYVALSDIVQVKGGSNGKDQGPPAGDELKLLSTLLTASETNKETSKQIMLSMFDDDEDPKGSSKKLNASSTTTSRVKISKASRPLDSAMQELAIQPESRKGKGENLANLMEEVAGEGPKRKTSVKKRSESVKSRGPPSRNGSAKKK